MTGGSGQIPLDFILPRRRARGRDDFVLSASNADAVAMIDAWRDWPDGRLALIGPKGAGKTHLAHVWMNATDGEKVAAPDIRIDDVPTLVACGAVVVEDADRIKPEGEAALFHLLNFAKGEGARLLLTGRGAPSAWRIETPDLASRLRGLTSVAIDAPDDALMTGLLARHLANRQLRVGEDVIVYLSARLERSAAAVAEAAAKLDEAALREGRAITRPFARKILDL